MLYVHEIGIEVNSILPSTPPFCKGRLGGIIATCNMSLFLPLIKASEILHEGKVTTLSLGRYEMRLQ